VTDPLLRLLENLPEAEPDRRRAARVRARCHAALSRSRQRRAQPRSQRLGETLLTALGAVYLLESIREALLLFGIG
jgi:hypothetical protein